MHTIQNRQSGTTHTVAAVQAQDHTQKTQQNSEGALFEEFSSLLDQISHQLSHDTGYYMPTKSEPVTLPEKPEAVKEEPVKAEGEVVEEEVEQQTTVYKEETGEEEAAQGEELVVEEVVASEETTEAVEAPVEESAPKEPVANTESQAQPTETAKVIPVAEQIVEVATTKEATPQQVTQHVAVPKEEVAPVEVQEAVVKEAVVKEAVITTEVAPREVAAKEVVAKEVVPNEVLPKAPVAPKNEGGEQLPQQAQHNQQQVQVEGDVVPQEVVLPEEVAVKVKQVDPQARFVEVTDPKAAPKSGEGEQVSEISELAKVIERFLADKGVTQPAASNADRFAAGSQRTFGLESQGGMFKALGDGFVARGVDSAQAIQSASQSGGKDLGSKLLNSSKELHNSDKSSKTKDLTQRQELRTLEKVEKALKEVARARDGKTISLRLDPPKLGNVKVDVSLRDGILHARLAADNPAVNSLLRDRALELQQTLRELGLEVDTVSVSVRDEGFSFEGQREGSEELKRDESEGDVMSSNTEGVKSNATTPQANSSVDDHWVA